MEKQLSRGPMTKSVLMTLPEGCWIASGVCASNGRPKLIVKLGSVEGRAEVWAIMKEQRVDGRNFVVMRDEEVLEAELRLWEEGREKTKMSAERQAEVQKTIDEIRNETVASTKTAPGTKPYPFSAEAGLLFRGRLTKDMLALLPEGSIVQSNTYGGEDRLPTALEKVGSLETREDLWRKLRSVRATNKTVNVWRDSEAYRSSAE